MANMTVRHSRLAAGLLLATLAAGGCGTVTVTATDPGARLYAGGRMLGRGTGEIRRRGAPETLTITAVTDDGRRSQTVTKREFTGFTLLTGIFTYGICLFACWEYPSAVLVAVPPAPVYMGGGQHGFDAPPPGQDPWLTPPPGWTPKAPAQ